MKLFNIYKYAFCFQIILFSVSCGNLISDVETDDGSSSGEVSYVRGLVNSKWEHVPFKVKLQQVIFQRQLILIITMALNLIMCRLEISAFRFLHLRAE